MILKLVFLIVSCMKTVIIVLQLTNINSSDDVCQLYGVASGLDFTTL